MGCRTGRAAMAGAVALGAVVAMAGPGRAQPLRGSEPAGAAALPDATFETAKAAFERLSEEERRAVQEALVWTGDYAATADGAFGRRTFEAVQAYQRRARLLPNGILDRAATATLLASASRARAGWDFAIVADPASGVRIGLPQKLLAKRSPNGNGGTRFQSADGRVTLDTRALPGGEAELKELYERNLANTTPGRMVGYKVSRPDFFVVSGETPTGRFYTRSATRGEMIRTFALGYDKALAADLDRLVIAIANSFVPFPDTAASPSSQVADIPMPPPRAREDARPAPAGATGLAVSGRRVLAPAGALDGCRDPLVDGAPARVVTVDRGHGLALLEPATARRGGQVVIASNPAEGSALVVFIASGEGGKAVAAPAEIASADRLYAPLQEGAAGGVVLDRTGAVAGMVSALATGTRAVAGLVPPASHRFADAAALRQLLGPDAPPSRDGGASEAGSLGAKAAEIAPALVRIACAVPARAP